MSELRVLFVTVPDEIADGMVQTLCHERLIACGNIIPGVRSHYWWDGDIASDVEAVVLMETTVERLPAAMNRIVELHPYDVPKVVAFDTAAVNAPYLLWALEQTGPAPGGDAGDEPAPDDPG